MICKKSDIDRWEQDGLFEIIKESPKYHRKYWEMGFLFNELKNYGLLTGNKKGLVFGCGEEKTIPALANLGLKITATDQSSKRGIGSGWDKSNQYCHGIKTFEKFVPHIISTKKLYENVIFKEMDMNDFSFFGEEYDFLWSLCALEHLGSIDNSVNFITKTISLLKPGGISIHTTEYNYAEDISRDDSLNCVFGKTTLLKLLNNLKAYFCESKISFTMGDTDIDNYVDCCPYTFDPHLKLFAEGYYITSIGFVIKKSNVKPL